MDGDGAVGGGAFFCGGADDFPLSTEAGDDAALGRNLLFTAHVDHDFFGLVFVVKLIHELAGVRHHRLGSPSQPVGNMGLFCRGRWRCVGTGWPMGNVGLLGLGGGGEREGRQLADTGRTVEAHDRTMLRT
jgi:hypothetical protein